MSKPAARVGDLHTCPMVNPGPVPHVGGPVSGPGCPSILLGGQPAARVGDMAVCAGPLDVVAMGSGSVLFGGQPAARMGDSTAHGGVIAAGCPSILIGDLSTASLNSELAAQVDAALGGASSQVQTLRAARRLGAPFVKAKCNLKKRA
jgi:uncharacterized Zn-binding protein involved in type VI secretion